MRWQAAAICLAGGLCGAAGAVLAVVLLGPADAPWWAGLGGLAAAVAVGVPLGFSAAGRHEGALRRVIRTLQAWADGRLGERAEPGGAEYAGLIQACNALADSVEARLRTQQRLADAHAELLRQGTELAALQERQRIARDLHDAVSQRLFGIHLLASAAVRTQGAPAAVQDLEALSREAQAEMRALLLQLRPPALATRPLADALADLCAEAERLGSTAWRLDLRPLPALGPGLEAGLFRIAQEAVTNVRRHAGARAATLEVGASEGRIVLAVDDDGRGFSPVAGRPDGMGLEGMRERAQALGGTLRVKSQPGRGTRVEATVPVVAAGEG